MVTDNGSYRPDATFSLRRIAAAMTDRVGHKVHPVSLMHSHKIADVKTGGIQADSFEPFVLRMREDGVHKFAVTPLFFGPSAAFAEYLPQRADAIREEHKWPELEVTIAPSVVNVADTEDTRIAEILRDNLVAKADAEGLERAAVALCDHGAPRIKVTEVRNFLAEQLSKLVDPDRFHPVTACSMERREGDEYAYNEPLLENLVGSPGFTENTIISLLFFQPGRHAGAGGDIAEICEKAEEETPGAKTFMTDLVGSHPKLIDILVERFAQSYTGAPVSWETQVLPGH